MKKLINILINFSKKKYFFQILNKIYLMIFDKNPKLSNEENLKKINDLKISAEDYLKKIDTNLYEEAIIETNKIIQSSDLVTKNYKNITFGGNYALEIHYFLTRYYKPKIIFETGVAAGYSSYTFLESIKKNNIGKLFSSDFPYFRLENPEQYIGIVVPNDLKKNWRLEILGDNKNFEKFKNEFNKIDLLFYDSDKRYSSKKKFFEKINNHINAKSIIIIDDLHNDSFFLEYVEEKKIQKWYILESTRKHIVGLIINE